MKENSIERKEEHIWRVQDNISKIRSENTGKQVNDVGSDVDGDFFVSTDDAKKYGIIDDVYKVKSYILDLGDKKPLY